MSGECVVFCPSYFFDLSRLEYAVLFEGLECVWKALLKIGDFLGNYPLGKSFSKIPSSAHISNLSTVWIGKECHIEPGVYIKGPAIIGDGCELRHGAYLRGNVILGKGCVVGHASEVKNSIFLDGAAAPHFAYIGDSILGNRVNVGAGFKAANLRLDRQEVMVRTQENKYPSGFQKFGVIIGDYAQLGCNVVTNPGTVIGKEVVCPPGVVLSGFIPSRNVVRPKLVQHYVPYGGVKQFLEKK